MSVFIQNTKTQAFLGRHGDWTFDAAKAENFITSKHAWYFAGLTMAGNYSVVNYDMDNGSCELVRELPGTLSLGNARLAA